MTSETNNNKRVRKVKPVEEEGEDIPIDMGVEDRKSPIDSLKPYFPFLIILAICYFMIRLVAVPQTDFEGIVNALNSNLTAAKDELLAANTELTTQITNHEERVNEALAKANDANLIASEAANTVGTADSKITEIGSKQATLEAQLNSQISELTTKVNSLEAEVSTFYKHTVSSTLIAHYEPIGMITSTTLPDREGTAQNGTITYGSNSDMTVHYGTMRSSEEMGATTVETELGFTAPEADMPAQWFATGSNVANLPLYPMLNGIATDSGMSIQFLYMWILFVVAIGMALLTYMWTKSMIFTILSMAVILAVGSQMTIIPAWILFVYLIMSAGLVYVWRQV